MQPDGKCVGKYTNVAWKNVALFVTTVKTIPKFGDHCLALTIQLYGDLYNKFK